MQSISPIVGFYLTSCFNFVKSFSILALPSAPNKCELAHYRLLGFPNRVLRTRFHPQRLGRFAPLSFPAYGGKIQATRFAGGR